MDQAARIWHGDWRARIRDKVRATGSGSILDFLGRYPAEPYVQVAGRFDDVAAVQLQQMQFEEVAGPDEFRRAACDGLCREIVGYLKRGWGVGRHTEFNTAGVYAGWMALLRYRAGSSPQALAKGESVWRELNRLDPPRGWKPAGPDDPILAAAFAGGWPEGEAEPAAMASTETSG